MQEGRNKTKTWEIVVTVIAISANVLQIVSTIIVIVDFFTKL